MDREGATNRQETLKHSRTWTQQGRKEERKPETQEQGIPAGTTKEARQMRHYTKLYSTLLVSYSIPRRKYHILSCNIIEYNMIKCTMIFHNI